MQKKMYSIEIHAPVKLCYQLWKDYHQTAKFLHCVIKVWDQPTAVMKPIDNLEQLHPTIQSNLSGMARALPLETVRHWLIQGPGGKVYELENTVILEIPDLFYCWSSTDPEDLAVQTSVSFLSQKDTRTLVLFECSFSIPNTQLFRGKAARLITDVLNTDDPLISEILADFKHYVERVRAAQKPNRKPKRTDLGQKPGIDSVLPHQMEVIAP